MPKIETPEEFVKRYAEEALSQNLYGLRVAVAAHDEQYLALLKQCGEALVLSRDKIQQQINEIYDAGGVEYIGLGSTLDKIDKALAVLKEAGVFND